MSITTRRGDQGETDLLFGPRVAKNHPRLTAVGAVDELNAVLGLARLHIRQPEVLAIVEAAQKNLIAVMGELSAGPDHAERYRQQGFARLEEKALEQLTAASSGIEARFPGGFHHWSIPGALPSHAAAWLELARTVCRRAERDVIGLPDRDQAANDKIIPWLNRLSDALWLCARAEEAW